ncbi:MAG TPA: hypothetical protein VGD63_10755 [Steroidobacteraceae bacterium]
MRQLIEMDFVGSSRRVRWPGLLVLLLSTICVGTVIYQYHLSVQRRAGLEYRMAALMRARKPEVPEDALSNAKIAVSAERAAQDLATPWTLLLAELEQASKDSQGQIALLGVEPDHAKHSVRVTAEARTLELALNYVQRLQSSRSLEYPMLDRHEIRADDPQRPVRFELTGQWKDST